jgi:hypothetical protein
MRRVILFFVVFIPTLLPSQTFPEQVDFSWPDTPKEVVIIPDSLKTEGAVILRDELVLTDKQIKRRMAVLIQNADGLREFNLIQLPENFNVTNYPNVNRQGRFMKNKHPYIYSYGIQYFAARIIKPNKKIIELPINYKVDKGYSVYSNGDVVKETIYNFSMDKIETGDIIEYMYKAEVIWNYQQVLIFPNSTFPKLKFDLKVDLAIQNEFKDIQLLYNTNIDPAQIKIENKFETGYILRTFHYSFENLKPIRYPLNTIAGATLPNISINNKRYYSVKSTGSVALYSPSIDPYKWSLSGDTVRERIYDKYYANIREYISQLRSVVTDSTANKFATELSDSLNTLQFISSESLKNGEIPQYAVYSSTQLNKGRLVEEFIFKNHSDLLSEANIFYYRGVLIDRRYSLIIPEYRRNIAMEKSIIIIPEKKSYRYYMPRYKGIKYFPDELPFYYEGANCALVPCHNCTGSKLKSNLLFLRTPKSSFNQNTRIESGVFKIAIDSLMVKGQVKESLGGQFSTILRHFYNNDLIDTTISAAYFKKCINKPHARSVELKQTGLSKTFPFKSSYMSSLTIALASKNYVDLSDWFSFTYLKSDFIKLPNSDFFVDFQFTDSYNYLFEFDKSIEILNQNDFSKKLSNEYFEISCNLVKQENNTCLLSIIVKVKQDMIPVKDASKVLEFVNMLDEINHVRLNYKTL